MKYNYKQFYLYACITIIAGIGLYFYDKASFFDYAKIMGTAFFVSAFFFLKQYFSKK